MLVAPPTVARYASRHAAPRVSWDPGGAGSADTEDSMPSPTPLSRHLRRLGTLLAGVVTAGLVGMPAAHASTFPVNLVLGAGQSGSIGTLASNTDVTPVSTCDPELSVSFDATMAGTVTVAPDAALDSYTCTVDYQVDGQSTGLLENVSVEVVPSLSINDVTLPEGSVGVEPGGITPSNVPPDGSTQPTLFTFTVTMSAPSSSAVTVAVDTADGTATAEGTATELADYDPVHTTVTFLAGATSQTVVVPVIPEDTVEPNETFFVNLSAPTGAVIVDSQGVGTILNDDSGPITQIP